MTRIVLTIIELQAVINKNVIEKIQINLKDLNEKDRSDLFKNIVLTVIDEIGEII